jgi:hypothetical protein
VVVGNRETFKVAVLLGNGDGTLRAPALFAVGPFPASITVGDFDQDGHPDLAVANSADAGATVSVLLGTGSGTFGPATDYPVGGRPLSVTTADLNEDGRLDLAVANALDSTVSVLIGNGDGTFGAATAFSLGASNPQLPWGLASADFDLDGHLDIATANNPRATVRVLLGSGGGQLGPATVFTVGDNPTAIVVGDFNGDGRPDIAVPNGGDSSISILLNRCGVVDTPTPTMTLTLTPTMTPTMTPTLSPTLTLTLTATSTATPSPTATASQSPTIIPTASMTMTVAPTATSTVTATPTETPTIVPTSTSTLTITHTPSPTASVTLTPISRAVPVRAEDDNDNGDSESRISRQRRERTNQLGFDDYHIEGNVVDVVLDADQPYAVIGTRDGLVRVMLPCKDGCPRVRVGDYLEADGVKQTEQLFQADSVRLTRNGERVH